MWKKATTAFGRIIGYRGKQNVTMATEQHHALTTQKFGRI